MSVDERNLTPEERLLKCPDQTDYSSLLECPVCYELIVPPVYPCSLGHNICSNCKANVATCPICRSVYANCRNVFLENLLEDCRVTCKYNTLGCETFLRKKELTDHELDCDFRPVPCSDCNRLVRYNEYIQHLKNEKKTNVMKGSSYRTAFDLSEGEVGDPTQLKHVWRSAWLRCLENDFFLRMETNGTDTWVFVTVFGTRQETTEWSCEIVVFNTKKKMSVSYNGPVNPIRTRGHEAAERGHCLSLSKFTLGAFKNDENDLEVGIKLYRGQAAVPSEVELRPSSSEPMCQGSEDLKVEPLLMEEDYEHSGVTYQTIAIPLFAIVSFPSTEFPGEIQVQVENPIWPGKPCPFKEPDPGRMAMEYFGADMSYLDSRGRGDGGGLPPRDSLSAIIGTRLNRLLGSINPAVLSLPITPQLEMNLYNISPPLLLSSPHSANPQTTARDPSGYTLFPTGPSSPRPSFHPAPPQTDPNIAGPSGMGNRSSFAGPSTQSTHYGPNSSSAPNRNRNNVF